TKTDTKADTSSTTEAKKEGSDSTATGEDPYLLSGPITRAIPTISATVSSSDDSLGGLGSLNSLNNADLFRRLKQIRRLARRLGLQIPDTSNPYRDDVEVHSKVHAAAPVFVLTYC